LVANGEKMVFAKFSYLVVKGIFCCYSKCSYVSTQRYVTRVRQSSYLVAKRLTIHHQRWLPTTLTTIHVRLSKQAIKDRWRIRYEIRHTPDG